MYLKIRFLGRTDGTRSIRVRLIVLLQITESQCQTPLGVTVWDFYVCNKITLVLVGGHLLYSFTQKQGVILFFL